MSFTSWIFTLFGNIFHRLHAIVFSRPQSMHNQNFQWTERADLDLALCPHVWWKVSLLQQTDWAEGQIGSFYLNSKIQSGISYSIFFCAQTPFSFFPRALLFDWTDRMYQRKNIMEEWGDFFIHSSLTQWGGVWIQPKCTVLLTSQWSGICCLGLCVLRGWGSWRKEGVGTVGNDNILFTLKHSI